MTLVANNPSMRGLLWIALGTCFIACAEPNDAPEHLCGDGVATLSIGVDDPLVAAEDQQFTIGAGNQGGYHVDISVRVMGLIDPDDVNIRMTLMDASTRLSLHRTDSWLLKIYESGPHCEYPRARLVLTNADDSLMELEQVEALVGKRVTLNIVLTSPVGDASDQFQITLSSLIRPE